MPLVMVNVTPFFVHLPVVLSTVIVPAPVVPFPRHLFTPLERPLPPLCLSRSDRHGGVFHVVFVLGGPRARYLRRQGHFGRPPPLPTDQRRRTGAVRPAPACGRHVRGCLRGDRGHAVLHGAGQLDGRAGTLPLPFGRGSDHGHSLGPRWVGGCDIAKQSSFEADFACSTVSRGARCEPTQQNADLIHVRVPEILFGVNALVVGDARASGESVSIIARGPSCQYHKLR